MTKKHFIKFAAVIKSVLEADKLCATRAQVMADMVIKIASEDNPLFDKERFLKACGLK